MITADRTIEEARQYISNNLGGVECPCCDQRVQEYRRRLNSGMAYQLIKLLRLHRSTHKEWIHVTELGLNGGGADFAKLRHWGLIREQDNTLFEKKNSGFWKIKPKGMDFIGGVTQVHKYVYLLNNKVTGFSDERIDIKQAIGKDFNYQDLMKGYGG